MAAVWSQWSFEILWKKNTWYILIKHSKIHQNFSLNSHFNSEKCEVIEYVLTYGKSLSIAGNISEILRNREKLAETNKVLTI